MAYRINVHALLIACFATFVLGASESLQVEIPPGLSLIGSPYDLDDPRVSAVFPNPPAGTMVYKLNPETKEWHVNEFQPHGWSTPDQPILAGEGFFVRNPTGTPFEITFTGVIPQMRSIDVLPGHNLLTLLPWEDLPPWNGPDIQLDPQEGDRLYLWDWAVNTFVIYTYSDIFGGWSPSEPSLSPGEGFSYRRSVAGPAPACENGTVLFSNLHAPMLIDECINGAGPEFQAQLYLVRDGTYVPVGEPVPFTALPDGSGSGYVQPSVVCLPGIDPGSPATLQMRVWTGADTFDTAMFRGSSSDVTVMAGGGLVLPPSLIGFEGWLAEAPDLVIQAEATEINEGESFRLTVVGGQLPIQWQRFSRGAWWDIPGETGTELHVAAASAQHSGTYRALRGDCPSNEIEIRVTTSLQPELHPGLNLIGSPYDLDDPRVSAVFPNPPVGTMVYKLNPETKEWHVNEFQPHGWSTPDQPILAGEGFFVRNPTGTPFEITFTGVVPQMRSVDVLPGHNLLTLLPWEDLPPWNRPDIQLNPQPKDQLLEFDSATGTYVIYTYSTILGGWTPSEPSLSPGEGFAYRRNISGGTATCWGQVLFSNLEMGAPAVFDDCINRPGPESKAQLYLWHFDDIPVGEPVPFTALADGSGSGYVQPSVVCLPGIAPMTEVTLQMRVWTGADTWESALFRGESNPVTVTAGGGLVLPPSLEGLQIFNVTTHAPFIQPEDPSVHEGESIRLTVVFNGAPPIQWQKQSTSGEWEDIPGGTGTELVIPSASLSDAGFYRASHGGPCPSNEVEIVVLPGEPNGLTAAQVEGGLRLAWPVDMAGFVLQEKTSVTGEWVDSSATITVVGDQKVVTIQTTGEAMFFRLAQ